MNRQAIAALWDQMRLRHGITLRVIDQFPDDKLASHPIAGMRTPIELLVHMYLGVSGLPEAAIKGTLASPDEKAIVETIKTKAQLAAFVQRQWEASEKTAREVTDAQLSGMVSTPWGDTFPGFVMFGFASDEYLHHRGQLYAFLRVFGIEPVMLWDFDHSAPEYQPQHATK